MCDENVLIIVIYFVDFRPDQRDFAAALDEDDQKRLSCEYITHLPFSLFALKMSLNLVWMENIETMHKFLIV